MNCLFLLTVTTCKFVWLIESQSGEHSFPFSSRWNRLSYKTSLFSTSFGFHSPTLNNVINKLTTLLSLIISICCFSTLLESLAALKTPNTLNPFLTSNSSAYSFKLYSPFNSSDHNLIFASRPFFVRLVICPIISTASGPIKKDCFWHHALAQWKYLTKYLSDYPEND